MKRVEISAEIKTGRSSINVWEQRETTQQFETATGDRGSPRGTAEKNNRSVNESEGNRKGEREPKYDKTEPLYHIVGTSAEMANAAGGVFVALVMVISASIPCFCVYNSGECFFNTKGSCEHMGQVYGIGESWITSDCYQCVCMEPFGVGCCDHEYKPVDYPDWCEIIRNPDSCTSVAVMRANHKLPCLWGRGRLRPAAGQPWMSENDPLF